MHVHLRTDRLVLRRFTPADEDFVVALDSDPEVMRYLTGRPTPRAEVRDEILPHWLAWHERSPDLGFWVAVEAATGDDAGWFHFRPHPVAVRADGSVREGVELGYRLRRASWGRGYATEGCRALIHRAFTELDVHRVYAETMAVNTASRRVMEKSGLRYVRTFHEVWPDRLPGDEHGEVEYAATRTEWAF